MFRKFNQLSLLKTIILWVALSIIAYTLLSAIWGQGHGWSRILAGWHINTTQDPLDRIKVTLTALGGVGAVVYLVIKYREHSALERGKADDKLVLAVRQLGDNSPQVRIAGVYALADIADTYGGPYHQRVVDILCGYLRTDRLLKDRNGQVRHATGENGAPDYSRPLSEDSPVESAVLSTLAVHLKSTHKSNRKMITPGPWSNCTINLQDAVLTEPFDLSNSYICNLNIVNTKFAQRLSFESTYFAETLNLDGTTFMSGVNFESATLTQLHNIEKAKVNRIINFRNAKFLHSISLKSTKTVAPLIFRGATFKNNVSFTDVTSAERVDFWGATFEKEVNFTESTFESDAIFHSATFEGPVKFRKVEFQQDSDFGGTTFLNRVAFKSTHFKQSAEFSDTTFDNDTCFIRVYFEKGGSFWGAHFNQTVDFNSSVFLDAPMFDKAEFNKPPGFANTLFDTAMRPLITPIGLPVSATLSSTGLPHGGRWATLDQSCRMLSL